jgi:hypothetical protein
MGLGRGVEFLSVTCARVEEIAGSARGVPRGTGTGVKEATHRRAVLGEVRRRVDVAAVEERVFVWKPRGPILFSLCLYPPLFFSALLIMTEVTPARAAGVSRSCSKAERCQALSPLLGRMLPCARGLTDPVVSAAMAVRKTTSGPRLTFSFPDVLCFLLGGGPGGPPLALEITMVMHTEARQNARGGAAQGRSGVNGGRAHTNTKHTCRTRALANGRTLGPPFWTTEV